MSLVKQVCGVVWRVESLDLVVVPAGVVQSGECDVVTGVHCHGQLCVLCGVVLFGH